MTMNPVIEIVANQRFKRDGNATIFDRARKHQGIGAFGATPPAQPEPSKPAPRPAPAPQAQQPVQQPTEQPSADGIQNSPDRRKRRIRQTPGVLIDGGQAGGKSLFGQ